MAKAAANGLSWTPASYWARPNSREVSILRADPDAEDATALLGLRFSKLPTELLDDVVVQLPSSTDVMTLAGVSSLWRVSVWRALARRHTQAWQYAGLVRAQFPCMHKGNAKQLRWPVEFDDVAPAVLSHQPWLKSVSWDDFKTWQAGVAAFLAQDARPPLEPITCSEELFASSLPELSNISISVRLLHGCTLIGSHDGCAQEFKLHDLYPSFNLYALDALASNDSRAHPCLMPYDRSHRAYCSRYGPEVEPYPVNSILQRVYKEFDDADPLSGTFSELRVVVFLTLGSKMVRVLDSPPDMTPGDMATVFTTTQDLPLAFLRAEHVCGRSIYEGQEFPADPIAAATWGVETRLELGPDFDFAPECSGQARLTIRLRSPPSVSLEGDDWAPSTLFLRRLFAARLEIDSDSNPSPAPAAPENGA